MLKHTEELEKLLDLFKIIYKANYIEENKTNKAHTMKTCTKDLIEIKDFKNLISIIYYYSLTYCILSHLFYLYSYILSNYIFIYY